MDLENDSKLDIGSAIREVRKRKGITIPQMCEGTGLSKGFISNVETNKTSPSIATLDSIARYLKVPLSYFLLRKEERLTVIRKEDRKVKTNGKSRIEYLTTKGPLRMMIVEMPPGSSTEANHAHEGYEVHLLMKGRLLAGQGEDEMIIEEGDTFSWNASVPHFVKNITDEPAILLIAIYTETDSQ
jgi:transcriptional regulator with XRE-family HTH domain